VNTFSKHLGEWCVQVSAGGQPGETVTVHTRTGQSKQVVLGELIRENGYGRLFKIAPRTEPARQTAVIGDLSRILAMFDRARAHLRFPAIVLDGIRISVAGERAREPGSLTITSSVATEGRRTWFGRVTRAGVYEAGRDAPVNVGPQLRAFAADPVTVAAEHGRLHGRCCFCNHPLRDERSTSVGYGPDCADHYGLPWGARAATAEPATIPQAAPAPAASAPATAPAWNPVMVDGEPTLPEAPANRMRVGFGLDLRARRWGR
jgi:Family of unknown function (DUF6011)